MEKRVYPREVVLAYIQMYITEDYEERTTESGEWVNIRSLVDADSDGKKLGFNITKGYVYDFHGKYHPSFIDFVKYHQKISEKDALETIVRIRRKLLRNGITITPPKPFVKDEKPRELEEIQNIPPMVDFKPDTIRKEKLGRKALLYLFKRNIKEKHIKKFGLKYVDDNKCWVCNGNKFIQGEKCSNCKGTGFNFYYGRVVIPTYENGKLVYFQGRDFLDRNKKYKYMNPQVSRSQVVYFYDLLPEHERIFITEGPIDAMTLYDYPTTSMMGNKISIAQAKKILWKKPEEVIFVPDNDPNPETKNMILKNTALNAKAILEFADYPLKVGVYNWFKFSNEKDLNSANIDYVDENFLFYFNNVKDKVRMKLDA